MAQVDAQEVADRLVDEQRDLWIHIDSSTPMEKYPGMSPLMLTLETEAKYSYQQSNMLNL